MKARSSTNAKTRYFRKDYAPARLAKSRKKLDQKSKRTSTKTTRSSAKTTTKITQNLKQTARKTGQSVKSAAKTLKQNLQKTHNASTRRQVSSSRSARRKKREPLTWREITLISQIGVSVFAIVFTFVFCTINDPVRRSEQELAKLAEAYYIEYLYPSSLGNKLYQPETILKDFTETGLPSVKLRQILLYNNGQHADSIEVFSNPYYHCDTNQSYLRYYPVEPYGPRDYTVVYNTACEKVSSIN